MGILQDLMHGNFSGVVSDIEKSLQKLEPAEKAFLAKLESDEWKMAKSLVAEKYAQVKAAGFTSAAFIQAGKEIVIEGAAQGLTILMTDAMAELNILASGDAAAQTATTVTA